MLTQHRQLGPVGVGSADRFDLFYRCSLGSPSSVTLDDFLFLEDSALIPDPSPVNWYFPQSGMFLAQIFK